VKEIVSLPAHKERGIGRPEAGPSGLDFVDPPLSFLVLSNNDLLGGQVNIQSSHHSVASLLWARSAGLMAARRASKRRDR